MISARTPRVLRATIVAAGALVIATGPVSGNHISFTASTVVRAAIYQPSSPDVAAFGTNVVFAWGQPMPNVTQVWTRQRTGNSWGSPVRLAKNLSKVASGISVFSSATRHYAVWSETVAGGGSRIFLASAAFGGSWSPPIQVSTNTGATVAINPNVVLAGGFTFVSYLTGSSLGPWTAVIKYRLGGSSWLNATLPGQTHWPVSLAASPTRLLVAWANTSEKVYVRRGAIGTNSVAWLSSIQVGNGTAPMVVQSGTRAVVLWHSLGDVVRRTSMNSGDTWSSGTLTLLDMIGPPVETEPMPYFLVDAAMSGASVAVTAAEAVLSEELGPGGGRSYRLTSANFGASWTIEEASLAPGDNRHVAYQVVSGVPKLTEAWIRVQGATYPYALRYHRQT